MKISPTGQAATDLVYATLLGGSSADAANAVAHRFGHSSQRLRCRHNAVHEFPHERRRPDTKQLCTPGATANAFLSVIGQDSNGNATLLYSTYLGGSSNDSAQGVAVLASASGTGASAVYVAGVTTSWDFPWHDNLQPFNGAQDAFVAKFNTAVGRRGVA